MPTVAVVQILEIQVPAVVRMEELAAAERARGAAAMEDGLDRAIDPGPAPEPGVIGPETFAPLPLTLGDAVERFATSPWVRATLGDDLTDLYTAFKRDEWARFCGAVTDWEETMYRQWIP